MKTARPSGTSVNSPKAPPTGNRTTPPDVATGNNARLASAVAPEHATASASRAAGRRSPTSQTASAPPQGRPSTRTTSTVVITGSLAPPRQGLDVQGAGASADLDRQRQANDGDYRVGDDHRGRQRLPEQRVTAGMARPD